MGSLPPLLWSWMMRQSPVNSSVAGFFFGTAAKGDGWTSVIRSSTSSVMIQATPMAKSRQKSRRMSCWTDKADLYGGMLFRAGGASPSMRACTKCSVVCSM